MTFSFYVKTLELTGPDSITMDDVANTLSNEIRSHVGYIPISEEIARHVLESTGTARWLIGGMLELYAMEREGRNSKISPTVEDITGRKAIAFDRFVRDNADAFKAIILHEHIRI